MNTRSLFRHAVIALATAAMVGLMACTAPVPQPIVSQPVAVAPSAAQAEAATPAAVARSTGPVRLAPRDPALENWKRSAAEKIHATNSKQLFSGRPHHLLQAVIVVEAAVDRTGNVTQSRIMRSPGIKSLDQVALASLKAASPLPAPPTALVAKGNLVFSETWLFQNDGRFQVRTLAMAQE